MPLQFRPLRIGFVNLILDFLEGQEIAVRYSNEVKDHLRQRLDGTWWSSPSRSASANRPCGPGSSSRPRTSMP